MCFPPSPFDCENSGIPAPASPQTGDLLRYNGGWERLGIGAEGELLQVSAGLPEWVIVSAADVGADPAGTAAAAVDTHKTAQGDHDAHAIGTLSAELSHPAAGSTDIFTYPVPTGEQVVLRVHCQFQNAGLLYRTEGKTAGFQNMAGVVIQIGSTNSDYSLAGGFAPSNGFVISGTNVIYRCTSAAACTIQGRLEVLLITSL